MTVEQAKAVLDQAQRNHSELMQAARHAPTQTIRRPAAISGSFTEQVTTYDRQQLEDAATAVRDAEKQLRAAQVTRHNQLATELTPKAEAVDQRIAELWQQLNAAYQERSDLLSDFARQCGCSRGWSHHHLGTEPPPLTQQQLATGGS